MIRKGRTGELMRPEINFLACAGICEILHLIPHGPGGEPLYRAKAATGQIQPLVPETDIVLAPASSIVSG